MDKDTRKILREAERQGFEVTTTKRGHPVVSKNGRRVATHAGTTGDRRALLNFIAQLRRAGFHWPPK